MTKSGTEADFSLPRLIHFFGPDGSGKSTQADILVDVLKRRGFRVKKSWLRAHHTLAFVLWKLLVRIGFYRTVTNCFGISTKIPAVNRDKSLGQFWSVVEFLSVLPHVWRINLSLSRGHCVVAERYVLDTVTSIAYTVNDASFPKSHVSRMLQRLIPNKTVFVFLDSDYETIRQRRSPTRCALGDDCMSNRLSKSSIEPRSYIDFQRASYAVLARSFHSLTINTSLTSVEETSKLILQHLNAV